MLPVPDGFNTKSSFDLFGAIVWSCIVISFSTTLPVPAVVIVKSALEGAVNVEPIEVISAKSSFVANSSPVAPALTLSACPAEPIDKDAPVPPLAQLIKSAD